MNKLQKGGAFQSPSSDQ